MIRRVAKRLRSSFRADILDVGPGLQADFKCHYHIALAVHIDMGPAHTLIAVTRGEDRGRAQADDQVPRPRGLHGGRHGFDRRSFQVPAGR